MKAPRHIKDQRTPKPVHPTAIRNHGLLGPSFVKQHKIIDEKWSMGDIVDEFHEMGDFLTKRAVFKSLQNKAYRRQLYKCTHNLRTQCRNGRTKLQNILHGNNVRAIRKYLLNNKGMQRLYQQMPVNQVMDNIDQRTFLMRKERDRLRHRLDALKQEYKLKLLELANIENRVKYENEFILEEDIKSNEFLEKIEKSKIRLVASKTINTTYKKVIQVLRQDETFYEPILRSLSKDIEDQAHFIQHVLYLGTPAIGDFKKLSREYRILQDKSRRSSHQTIQTISAFKKISPTQTETKSRPTDLVVNISKRYARETKSMLQLKKQLEDVESIIRQIKMATLCSKAREVFPRIRSQIESNYKLIKQNDIGQMHHMFWIYKGKLASEKKNVLQHYYCEEEEKRLLRIKMLEKQIKEQDIMEEDTLSYIKNRADIFVIIRYFLWNLSDTLKYVGRAEKLNRIKYPNSYLKLPLLKYEMYTMRACPPEIFEEDSKLLLTSMEKKLQLLMKSFIELTDTESRKEASKTMDELLEEYHVTFLSVQGIEETQDDIEDQPLAPERDLFEDTRLNQNVPNRNQIKFQSARIVEELSKKED